MTISGRKTEEEKNDRKGREGGRNPNKESAHSTRNSP